MAATRKTLQSCVAFARFCDEQQVNYLDLRDLMQLARKAFATGEREANTGKSADKQRNAFEVKAKSLGFAVQWPGLWPTLRKGNRDIYLPEV